MEDLISREALLNIVGKMPLCWEYGQAVSDIYDIIKNQPPVEVVPVVRCKDCVHFDLYLMCCKSRLLNGHTVLEGYCHNGKARE